MHATRLCRRSLLSCFPVERFISCVGERDGTVKFWNVTTQQAERTVRLLDTEDWPKNDRTWPIMALWSSGQLLTVGTVELLRLWNSTTGAAVGEFSRKKPLTVAFSRNSQSLAALYDNEGTLWNVTMRQVSSKFNGFSASAVAFSPDGRFLALGMTDGTVRLTNARPATAWAFETRSLSSLTFSADGSLLASGYKEGIVNI